MSEQGPFDLGNSAETIPQTWEGYTREELEAKAGCAPWYGSEVELQSFQAESSYHEQNILHMSATINNLCALFGVDHTEWTRYVLQASTHDWREQTILPESITRMAASMELGAFLQKWCFNVMPIEDSDDVHELNSSVALTIQLTPNLKVKFEGSSAVWRWFEYTDPDTGAKYAEANHDEEIQRLIDEDKADIAESFVDYNMKFTAWFSRIDE